MVSYYRNRITLRVFVRILRVTMTDYFGSSQIFEICGLLTWCILTDYFGSSQIFEICGLLTWCILTDYFGSSQTFEICGLLTWFILKVVRKFWIRGLFSTRIYPLPFVTLTFPRVSARHAVFTAVSVFSVILESHHAQFLLFSTASRSKYFFRFTPLLVMRDAI